MAGAIGVRFSLAGLLNPLVFILASAGCQPTLDSDALSRDRQSAHELSGFMPAPSRTANPSDRSSNSTSTRVIDLSFDVVRIDFPMSSVRHSRKIWNHVDELRVDPQGVARLKRNGLRIGAAPVDAWSAIRAVVDVGGAEVRRDQLSTGRDQPLAIGLSTLTDSESVFSYDLQGRLSGKTFSAGQKLLIVDYQIRPTLGGRVDLAVTLEIRSDRGVMTWERREGMIRQVPDYDRHVFSEIAVSVSLKSGEFLVVGLGEQTENCYLLGSRFMTTVRAGQDYETMYFITPQPYQTRGEVRRNR